jgi:hypothetical protein
VLVVVLDELVDLALEVGHGVEGTAADCTLRDQSEPGLNLAEPRGVVNVKAGPYGEPGFDSGLPVRAVVIASFLTGSACTRLRIQFELSAITLGRVRNCLTATSVPRMRPFCLGRHRQ